MRWTPQSLARACAGELIQAGASAISGAFLDSRRPLPGGLFVPIVAARDGHEFAVAAAAGGAAALLWQRDRPRPPALALSGPTIVEVDDTLAALTRLAGDARRRIDGPVVAITGSNGKTTTRAMVEAVLRTAYAPVLCTRGNLNNHLGVPLSLLAAPDEPAAAVLELGMSAPGENARLAELVAPTIGIITSIALEHLEFMGSLEAIAEAEAEIIPHIARGGLLVLPEGEPLLAAQVPPTADLQVRRHGLGVEADVRVVDVEVGTRTRAVIVFRDAPNDRVELRLRPFGVHNARNAAAALAVGRWLGLAVPAMVEALEAVEPVGDRGRVLEHHGNLLIGDCYNANPGSMEAALRSLARLREGGRAPLVAVLGDMLELGPREHELHREVGRLAAELGVDAVIGFGPRSRHLVDGAVAGGAGGDHVGEDVDEAARALARRLDGERRAAVLFKGSRGMALERVLARHLEG